MKRHIIKILFMACMCLICPLSASAEVDWTVLQTINTEKKPVDVVMSVRGEYIYVLTEDGIVFVYDSDGNIKGQIEAGKDVDQIATGPTDNLLILKNKKNNEVQLIVIDLIREINIGDSPWKGNADAPIVIVDFTDYQ